MIVRCPSCSTRYDLPASRFDADGTMMKCSVCNHGWIEGRAVEISRETVAQLPAVIEPSYEPDHEIRRLVDASRDAQEAFAARRKRRRTLAACWFGLAMVTLSPAVVAFGFPETVVSVAPASIALYEKLGRTVNIYGLDIRKVELQHIIDNGKAVIAVKGEIANTSSSTRKIPWMRFGVVGSESKELYSWLLETNARPLNPGESTNFVTRIASPPEGAAKIEIRFARADEIGSNHAP